jgi:phosphotriesterase-related protein
VRPVAVYFTILQRIGAAMDLMTVTGLVKRDQLGVILPHEHLFIDLRNQFTESQDPEKYQLSRDSVDICNLGALRINPYALKDNLILDNLEDALQEVEHFRSAGGQTIVDCTSLGIGRDMVQLQTLATRSGLNIVAGCGYYTYDTHPATMDEWSVEKIADEMLGDMLDGVDGTGIRAGIYGEIGTSAPLRANELKCLQATAMAFRQHRAEIQVHTFPWARVGLEAAQVLIDGGVDPGKIVICHIDIEFHVDYLEELLRLGVNIEFDNFGKEFYILKRDRGFAGGVFARDIERVQVIGRLLERGFLEQLLITNDVCLKTMWRRYGGFGYDHILKTIVPMLLDEGIDQGAINTLLRDNPARILCD